MVEKKQFLKLTLIILALMTLFLTLIPMQVNAAEFTCPSCGNKHNLDWIQKIDFDFTNEVFSGQLFEKSDVDAGPLDINAVLAFDITQADSFGKIWNYGKEIYNKVLPIGQLLAVVYFLLAIMEKALQDNFNAEQFARNLVRLTAMLLVLQNGFDIMEAFMKISTFVYQKLQAMTTFAGNPKKCKFQECKDRSLFQSIGNILSMIIPYLLMSIAKLIIRVIAWSRVLNLVIRVMFAPIGMADSIRGGTSSQGFKYMKKIIACSLQGALILGVSVAYNLIVDVIQSNGGGTAWIHSIILAAVMVTLIFKTSNMAEDALGC